MAKKVIRNLKIDHLRYPDKGIAFFKADELGAGLEKGIEVNVKNGLPGQLLEVECSKKKRQHVGRILNVLERAADEVVPSCSSFGVCGGCSFLNLDYKRELEIKKGMMERLLGNFWDGEFPDVMPAPSCFGYRNKMEFSFGDSGRESGLALGIRKRERYYEVILPTECALVPEDFKALAVFTVEYFRTTSEVFYHRMRHTGSLRYLILRRGEFTGELLVNLVTTAGVAEDSLRAWVDGLLELADAGKFAGKVVGILHTASDALSDAVVPEDVRVLWGRDYFYEKICGLTFKISKFSFFQTYSGGAELLYKTVAEFVGESDRVYDLYCGTGTIAQVISPYVKEVVGIELVDEAVVAAKENADVNGIGNCRFISGDVLKVLEERSFDFEKPDVLVLDPPRSGVHPKALGKVIDFGAGKVVYVSCKPTSLVRELEVFEAAGYRIVDLRIHDMFPRTPHVETVVLMTRVDSD